MSSLYVMKCYSTRERVVIPPTLQKRNEKDFYVGHQRSTRIKSLMRSYVHWSNMDKDIENAVKSLSNRVKAIVW